MTEWHTPKLTSSGPLDKGPVQEVHVVGDTHEWDMFVNGEVVRCQWTNGGIFTVDADVVHAGPSKCPICGRRWLVTPRDDCMLPVCGCFGEDTSAENPNRPCEPCGLHHAWNCEKMPTVGGG